MSLKGHKLHKCKRCGYEWMGINNPVTCANKKCRSLYWDTDYKFPVKKKKTSKRISHVCKRCGYKWFGKEKITGCPNPRCCSIYWNQDYVLNRKPKKGKYRYKNENN